MGENRDQKFSWKMLLALIGAVTALILAVTPLIGAITGLFEVPIIAELIGGSSRIPTPAPEPTAAVVLAPTHIPTPIDTPRSTSPVDNCFTQFFEELPENKVEVGAVGVDVNKRDERAVIKFTEDGNTIGAIKLNFFPESHFFKIEEIVGLNCQTITEYKNVTGGDKNILRDYVDVLEFTVENSTYRLRIGDRDVVFRVVFRKVP